MEINQIDILSHEKDAIDDSQACEKILNFLERNSNGEHYISLGQNISFDLKFLDQMFLKNGKIKELKQLLGYRTLDIMQIALLRNLEGYIELEKQDLDSIIKALGMEYPDCRHHALADCIAEYRVFTNLVYSFKGNPSINLNSKYENLENQ